MKHLLVPIILLLVACSSYHRLYEEEKNVLELISGGNETIIIKLDTVVNSKWSSAIFLEPYSDLSFIEEKNQIDLSCITNSIEHHDSFVIIGFLQGDYCAGFIEIPRTQKIELLSKVNQEVEPINRKDFTLKFTKP
ncbi:MAG: hypothetical protein RIF46_08495 [Cyclobacteriaceae bacterium]